MKFWLVFLLAVLAAAVVWKIFSGGEPDSPVAEEPAEEPDQEAFASEIDRWLERLRETDDGAAKQSTPGQLAKILKGHKDFYARLGAATALGELRVVDSVPALIEALDDRDDLVRTAAGEALHRITGRDFGFTDGLAEGERRAIQERWRAWWRERAR